LPDTNKLITTYVDLTPYKPSVIIGNSSEDGSKPVLVSSFAGEEYNNYMFYFGGYESYSNIRYD
jgi:hypothetical protein